MTARGAAGRCPSSTWLGPRLLLVCLLVSRSIAKEVSEHCSHMIGNGHLQVLQQLIDSQMETSCQIAFDFVDQEQFKNDTVCYLKKAFFLVKDIIEETMRFKDNTPNANATERLQELSLRLKSCFTTDYEEENKACVRTFHETPLQLLEKIKDVFNKTKNLLEKDWNTFSKNCNNSFAKCSSQDVVTKPDCNCLFPKATPSSDLASASPHQPPAPSMAPLAGLAWDDSQRTEGNSLLPSEQPLRTEDPGSAKQRLPRSTCQSLESPETPNYEDRLTEDSEPHPSAEAPIPAVEAILKSSLGTNWVLEEASGEASEGFLTQEAKLSPSKPVEDSIQAEMDRSRDLSASSPFHTSTEDQHPAETDTPLPEVYATRPTGQTQNHTPEKTDGSSTLPGDHQEPGSPHISTLGPQGLSNPAIPFAQSLLPRSHSWGIVLPLRELEGKRSTRDRRSPTELEGGPASEGAARPVAHFNSIPLTDTGLEKQHGVDSNPNISESDFHLLVPGIILVLLAVGGLLFYRWKRRLGTQDYLFMEGDIMGLSTTTLSCHLPGNVACHYQSSCRPRLDESSLDGVFPS